MKGRVQPTILRGKIVDIISRRTFPGEVQIQDGRIAGIQELPSAPDRYIVAGFADPHVHPESSLCTPSRSASMCVPWGVLSRVADTHEAANNGDEDAVHWAIEDADKVPMKSCFAAPSCVPSTCADFETSGAVLDSAAVARLLAHPRIGVLGEVMNFPGAIAREPEVMRKISHAQALGKPIDGHAPGVTGEQARLYYGLGISTDHECTGVDEARDKLRNGLQYVMIREGSAARNFNALAPLIGECPDRLMFCTDDLHPDKLVAGGGVNSMVVRALEMGFDLYDVLRIATLNPVRHYGLDLGLLRPGDPADLLVVEDLRSFRVLAAYVNGQKVAENGKALFELPDVRIINNFSCSPISTNDLRLTNESRRVRVIKTIDGELLTEELITEAPGNGQLISDVKRDILKLVVVCRYGSGRKKLSIGLVSGFGLRRGAAATTFAHDSHNIIAVGVSDEDIARAINLVISSRGGLAVVDGNDEKLLPLPICGLMSDRPAEEVARVYEQLDRMAKEQLGAQVESPLMLLSFLSLIVIGDLKLSDRGLFNTSRWELVPLFVN